MELKILPGIFIFNGIKRLFLKKNNKFNQIINCSVYKRIYKHYTYPMENTEIIKKRRGRPFKVVDEQEQKAKEIKSRFNKRKTINTQSYFDIYNPPTTEQELDKFVETHIRHVKAILESNGIINYAFTETKLEYDKKLTNLYLICPVLIFNEEQYEIANKIQFSFNVQRN